MYKFKPRCLTITERKEVEYLRDMLNGNINRMCVTDDLAELYKNATYALKRINRLVDIAKSRFPDQTKENQQNEMDRNNSRRGNACFGDNRIHNRKD